MAPFGRQAGLSLVISFNETDWTSGWHHLLKGRSRDSFPQINILGATLFLTPEYELTIDPDDSIALNPNEIPLVTFRKRITSKLGKPYGSCRIGFSIESEKSLKRTVSTSSLKP